jgi:uncharacterized protein (DUF1501 family)
MDRRFFLKNTLSVSVISSLALTGLLKSYRPHANELDQNKGRILVLIQLDGGNDGLNTVIPLDQYSKLTAARKNILIPDSKVLALHDTTSTGLHPSLREIQKLYNDKKVMIIQGVGCPNPDLSHFKAIDIWHTASDAAGIVSTGWLGRYLEQQNEHGIKYNPEEPSAIQIAAALSKVLQGTMKSKGMVIRDTGFFYDLVPGRYDLASDTVAGHQLSYIRNTMIESKDYLSKVKSAAQRQKNLSRKYPAAGDNQLADQLKIVAQLIGGGLQTKVYIVKLGGFDTHDKQVEFTDPTKGDHANLLSQLSIAMDAFQDDLSLMDKQDHVLSMVYSEFGRRIKSNSSYGCDHGTSAPVLLFGSNLKNGLVGTNPQIPSKVTVNDNIPMQNDFRSVYASVLKVWFDTPQPDIDAALLGFYPSMDIFKA